MTEAIDLTEDASAPDYAVQLQAVENDLEEVQQRSSRHVTSRSPGFSCCTFGCPSSIA